MKRFTSLFLLASFFLTQFQTHNLFAFSPSALPTNAISNLQTRENFEQRLVLPALDKNGDLEVAYDADQKQLTLTDKTSLIFEIWQVTENGELGELMSIGTLRKLAFSYQRVEEIKFSHLNRWGKNIPVYIFSKSEDPDYLLIRERLAQGGLGRVLKFRGQDEFEGKINIEYFYQDKSVTVFDYVKGNVVKMTLAKTASDQEKGIAKTASFKGTDALQKLTVSGTKMGTAKQKVFLFLEDNSQKNGKAHFRLIEKRNWKALKLRGPPSHESKTLLNPAFDISFKNSSLLTSIDSLSNVSLFGSAYLANLFAEKGGFLSL